VFLVNNRWPNFVDVDPVCVSRNQACCPIVHPYFFLENFMAATLTTPSSALIVVDVQASFTTRPYWSADDLPAYLKAQNDLIAGYVAKKLPVVRVFHIDTGPFAKESGFVRPLDGLINFGAALTIEKNMHSAFAGTPLAQWLIQRGIRNIAVSGIRTEQCCETTTRHASDQGFNVSYVTEATLTFPMTHANGRTHSAADIKERTELVLAGRFAKIATVAEALATIQ
jgi:nicotinamidase-related amidase